jgi:hypothetical protein
MVKSQELEKDVMRQEYEDGMTYEQRVQEIEDQKKRKVKAEYSKDLKEQLYEGIERKAKEFKERKQDQANHGSLLPTLESPGMDRNYQIELETLKKKKMREELLKQMEDKNIS